MWPLKGSSLLGRSGTRSAVPLGTLAIADLLWCAASLLSKPLILVHEALLEPTATAYWLIIVAAMAPSLLAMALLVAVPMWAAAPPPSAP
jgi:hypothetical protein